MNFTDNFKIADSYQILQFNIGQSVIKLYKNN